MHNQSRSRPQTRAAISRTRLHKAATNRIPPRVRHYSMKAPAPSSLTPNTDLARTGRTPSDQRTPHARQRRTASPRSRQAPQRHQQAVTPGTLLECPARRPQPLDMSAHAWKHRTASPRSRQAWQQTPQAITPGTRLGSPARRPQPNRQPSITASPAADTGSPSRYECACARIGRTPSVTRPTAHLSCG